MHGRAVKTRAFPKPRVVMPSLFVAATSSPSTSASPSSASSGGDEEYGLPIIDPDPLYSSDDDPEIDEMRRGARSSTHRLTPLKTKAEVDKGHEQSTISTPYLHH